MAKSVAAAPKGEDILPAGLETAPDHITAGELKVFKRVYLSIMKNANLFVGLQGLTAPRRHNNGYVSWVEVQPDTKGRNLLFEVNNCYDGASTGRELTIGDPLGNEIVIDELYLLHLQQQARVIYKAQQELLNAQKRKRAQRALDRAAARLALLK